MKRLGVFIASTGVALALGMASAGAADLSYEQRTFQEEAYTPPVRERIIVERPVRERVIVERPVEEEVVVRKVVPPVVAYGDDDDYPVYAHRPWGAPGWHHGGWGYRGWGHRGFYDGGFHHW